MCSLWELEEVKSKTLESEIPGFKSQLCHWCSRLTKCAVSLSSSVVLSLKWANNSNATYLNATISRSNIDNVKTWLISILSGLELFLPHYEGNIGAMSISL